MELRQILTEEEIAALLAQRKHRTPSGRGEEKRRTISKEQVAPFDPRKPNRLNRDQVKRLNNLFNAFAERLSERLNREFRMEASTRVIGMTQERTPSFLQALSKPGCIYQVDFAPMRLPAFVVLQPSLVFSMVDRMLGGSGQVELAPRELTEVESDIAVEFIEVIMKDMAEEWKDIVTLKPKITGCWSDPERVQTPNGKEILLVIVIELSGEEDYGAFTVCFPFGALAPYLDSFDRLDDKSSEMDADLLKAWRGHLENSLTQVEVGLPIVLGESKIAIGDVLNLRLHDVIVLEKRITEPVEMQIGSETVVEGHLGVYNKQLALRVLDIREA
jgi:flagellar motor switch protein FliM